MFAGMHRLACLIAASPMAAWACPDCPTSRAVLEAVLDDQFWTNLLLTPLPFLVVGLISALLYRIGQEGRVP
jgi:hypothetical protein